MMLGLRGRLVALSALPVLAILAIGGVYLERELRASQQGRMEEDLRILAAAARELASERLARGGDPDAVADDLGELFHARVTLIEPGGVVLGDSEVAAAELAALDNHRGRPEVAQARGEGLGVSLRHSTTVDDELLYVALELPEGGGVVRLARRVAEIEEVIGNLRLLVLFAGAIVLAGTLMLAALGSYLTSRTLRNLVDSARAIARGRHHRIPVESADELAGLAGSLNEMSEEIERTVSELAEERARFEAVLEGMSDAVIAADAERRITLMNPAARALLDLDHVPRGRSLLELIRAPALQKLIDEPGAGDLASAEFDLPPPKVRNPALERRVLARVTRQRGGGLILVLHDITEIRRLERVRRDFVANVSHELRTPVSIIRANLETLQDGALTDPEHGPALAEGALRNAGRLTHLIEDLLDLSRLEAGRYELEAEEVRIAEVARRATESVEREIGLEVSEELVAAADAKALEQILVNLLDNAAKYTPESAAIEVVARRAGDAIRIEVRDTGPGIEPAHQSRVFERFYRVDPGRSRQMGGTGLGLSIVKHLVEAMGGRIGFEPNDPRGSVFWVTIPARQA